MACRIGESNAVVGVGVAAVGVGGCSAVQLLVQGNGVLTALEAFALIATVFAAVYHAEVVAAPGGRTVWLAGACAGSDHH